MTAELLIQEVLSQAGGHAFTLAFKFMLVALGAFIIKLFVESLANYFMFRYNKHVGIGTRIEIYGKIGIVKHIGYTSFIIDTDNGEFHIPMKDWKNAKYVVLKDK